MVRRVLTEGQVQVEVEPRGLEFPHADPHVLDHRLVVVVDLRQRSEDRLERSLFRTFFFPSSELREGAGEVPVRPPFEGRDHFPEAGLVVRRLAEGHVQHVRRDRLGEHHAVGRDQPRRRPRQVPPGRRTREPAELEDRTELLATRHLQGHCRWRLFWWPPVFFFFFGGRGGVVVFVVSFAFELVVVVLFGVLLPWGGASPGARRRRRRSRSRRHRRGGLLVAPSVFFFEEAGDGVHEGRALGHDAVAVKGELAGAVDGEGVVVEVRA
mmetsp:Transcript_7900/g.25938  ORF Transcript_7900/g.25938 Transcript_7900/m.25938 type:complete len:268 (+) Transcript_7900:1093-1896(+)